ncbi:transposase [Enterococcus sp. DIV1420a]
MVAKYIREKEIEDRVRDSINKREYQDPFSKPFSN